MMWWSSVHQFSTDITNFVKAAAPIVIAYLTYHYRKQPSAKQRKEEKRKKDGK